MGQATFANNTTLKYGGKLSGGQVVPANSYAIASFILSGQFTPPGNTYSNTTPYGIFTVYYGAGTTVASSYAIATNTSTSTTVSASLIDCVYFTNSP